MPSINESKCVLVTGATSGIGRALALAISSLQSKPKVIGTGRRPERLKELEDAGIETARLELDAEPKKLKKDVQDLIEKYPEVST